MDGVEPEKEKEKLSDKKDRKRKSEDDESPPFPKRKSVIEAGGVENENNPVIDKQQDAIIKRRERLKTYKNTLFQITYDPHNAHDILKTGRKYKPKIKGKVQEYIGKGVRFYMVYKVKLVKFNIEGEEEIKVNAYLNSSNRRLLDMVEFDDVYSQHMSKIQNEFENFTGEGSGWILEDIQSIDLHISRYTPISGSSFIPTPKHLASKKAIVNVNNRKENDEKCFLWSVLAHLFPVEKDANRVKKYKKHLDTIKYGDINMPMKLKDIDKFEKLNNLIINVYGCTKNGKEIWPRRISKKRGKEAINLLMLDNGKRYHYVLIKNLNKLLGKSGAVSNPKNFCPYCCHGFDKRYLKDGQMVQHMDVCFKYKGTKVIMPEKGKTDVIRFKNYSQQLEVPYTIYADFEAVLKKDEDSGNEIHEISGYSICVKSPYEEDQMWSYRGENAGDIFIGHIHCLGKE